jgi:hypothetical protein
MEIIPWDSLTPLASVDAKPGTITHTNDSVTLSLGMVPTLKVTLKNIIQTALVYFSEFKTLLCLTNEFIYIYFEDREYLISSNDCVKVLALSQGFLALDHRDNCFLVKNVFEDWIKIDIQGIRNSFSSLAQSLISAYSNSIFTLYTLNETNETYLKVLEIKHKEPLEEFITHTPSGHPDLIWLLTSSTIVAYSINQNNHQIPVHSYPATSACQIEETILILTENTLKLWQNSQLLPCELKDSAMVITLKRKKSTVTSRRVTSLKSNGNSVLIGFSNSEQTIAKINFIVQGFVLELLKGLEYVLDVDYPIFWTRFITELYSTILPEFDCFMICLFSFFNHDYEIEIENHEKTEWEILLASEVMKNLRNKLQSSIKIEHLGKMSSIYKKSKDLWFKNHVELRLDKYLKSVVLVLFNIYQDFSLDLTLKSEADQLGLFLGVFGAVNNDGICLLFENLLLKDGFGVRYEFKEYEFPVLIYDFVLKKLKGESIKSPLDDLESIGKKNLELLKCCQGLKNVCSLYGLIHEEAHVVVSRMVDLGVKVERLPVGIGLPLRQALFDCRDSPELATNPTACKLLGRRDLASFDKGYEKPCDQIVNKPESIHQECPREDVSKFRFLKDDRIKQIHSLLFPVEKFLDISATAESSSIEDIQALQQKALSTYALKYNSLSIGQAMLTFESEVIVPTEVFPIPPIVITARLPPLNASITYQKTETEWPDFHLGVSYALKIQKDCTLTSSWIVFNQNKNNKLDPSHAGFIFGLGLNQHLKKLESTDSLRNYFDPRGEIVTMAHLLGIAFAYIKTKNTTSTKMMATHIDALLPSGVELVSAHLVKSSAVFGYGLIHLSSSELFKYDIFLNVVERACVLENAIDDVGNDLYLLCCGFSIGMIGLGCLRDCLVAKVVAKRLILVLGLDVPFTAKIACAIGLGLVGLKSNSAEIKNALKVPESKYWLQTITPEYLLILTVSKLLCFWDDIKPDQDWISTQIPEFLLNLDDQLINSESQHMIICYYSIITGCCFSIGLKYAGSFEKKPFDTLFQILTNFSKILKTKSIYC